MKKSLVLLLALFFVPPAIRGRLPQSKANSSQVTMPPAATQTVPADMSYQLGQQSGKIDAMTKRLDNIEGDVKEIGKDVGRLNVYGSIAGIIFLAIIIPLAIEGLRRQIYKDRPSPGTAG